MYYDIQRADLVQKGTGHWEGGHYVGCYSDKVT